MNKCCVIIAIAFVCFFLSCSKDTESLGSVVDISESFSYSDTIEIYSDDDLSSATIVVSSNDEESFLEAKSSLILISDLEGNNFSNPNVDSDSLSSEFEPGIVVNIDILKISSNSKIVGIGHKNVELKSANQPTKHTYQYDCIESDYNMFVRFIYNPASETVVIAKFGRKDCWLCSWYWSHQIDMWWWNSGHDDAFIGNQWNGEKSVWKLGVKVTTDLNRNVNYRVYLEAR